MSELRRRPPWCGIFVQAILVSLGVLVSLHNHLWRRPKIKGNRKSLFVCLLVFAFDRLLRFFNVRLVSRYVPALELKLALARNYKLRSATCQVVQVEDIIILDCGRV